MAELNTRGYGSGKFAATIGKLAEDFSAAVMAAVRAASLEDLTSTNGAARPATAATKAPTASKKTAKSTAKAATSKAPTSKAMAPKVTAAATTTSGPLTTRILQILKATKGGLRADQLRIALGVSKKTITPYLRRGLTDGHWKTTGQRRGTTYHPAAAG